MVYARVIVAASRFTPAAGNHAFFAAKLLSPKRNFIMYCLSKLCASAVCLAFLGGLAAVPAHAQILQNGSFEQGTFNSGGAQSLAVGSTAISNWTVTNAEIALLTNGNYGLATPYGSYFLDLTGYHDAAPYGGVTQSIATTSGASYHLSFSLGADQTNPAYIGPVGASASAGGTSQTFTFTPPVGSAGNQWGTFGLDFIATGSTTPITIIGTQSTGGQFIGLDNVSVTPNAPVPEASTTVSLGLLLMLGLGGLAVAKKRKHSAASA